MRWMGIVGILVMLGIGILMSRDRRRIEWRVVIVALIMQLLFAFCILKTEPGRILFENLNNLVIAILDSTKAGASFVFGNLASFGPIEVSGNTGTLINIGAGFAFLVLPTIIFFSSLMAILYHIGFMQIIIKGIAWFMARTLKTSGPESLSVAADIFVGQTESPLVIRPYLPTMTLSEINAVMTGGFATIAGGVLAAYVGMLSDDVPNIAGHLLAASIMSAPSALMMAKIFVPETETVKDFSEVSQSIEKVDINLVDAAARGASEGLQLALNVGAMLIAFLALVALIDSGLGFIGGLLWNLPHLNLAWVFGKVFWFFAYVMGVPFEDCGKIGDLLGTKLFLNEFVAYSKLQDYSVGVGALSEKAKLVAAYALCGFANIGSVGIQIGGIGTLVPERRKDLARLALRAMIAGNFATWVTACIAGILV